MGYDHQKADDINGKFKNFNQNNAKELKSLKKECANLIWMKKKYATSPNVSPLRKLTTLKLFGCYQLICMFARLVFWGHCAKFTASES